MQELIDKAKTSGEAQAEVAQRIGAGQATGELGVWDPGDSHQVEMSRTKGDNDVIATEVTGEFKLAVHPNDQLYGRESCFLFVEWANGNWDRMHLGSYASEADLQAKLKQMINKKRLKHDLSYQGKVARVKEMEADKNNEFERFKHGLGELINSERVNNDEKPLTGFALNNAVDKKMNDYPFDYARQYLLDEAIIKRDKNKSGYYAFRHEVFAVFSQAAYMRAGQPWHHQEDRAFVKVFETKTAVEAENHKKRVVGNNSKGEAVVRTYMDSMPTRPFDGNNPAQPVRHRFVVVK